MEQYLYIASHDTQGGILRCRLDDSGKLTLLSKTLLDRPAYLCAEGNRLYAAMREPFMLQSGVAAFEIRPDGTLRRAGDIQPVHGTVAAHILAVKGRVYTANYLSGSTTLLPDRVLAHTGHGADPLRQDCSHPHCLTPTPEGLYICICDLGTDCIYVCTPELREVSRVTVDPGSGPRHLVFSPDGKFAYCSNELTSTVSVFAYEEGRLTHITTLSALPEDYSGENYGSAIRLSPDGKALYMSNRGHDSVCIWNVEGAHLSGRRFLMTNGRSPREINLAGDWLLCGNEGSGTVTVFSLKTGLQTDSLPVERPWCILPVDPKELP